MREKQQKDATKRADGNKQATFKRRREGVESTDFQKKPDYYYYFVHTGSTVFDGRSCFTTPTIDHRQPPTTTTTCYFSPVTMSGLALLFAELFSSSLEQRGVTDSTSCARLSEA